MIRVVVDDLAFVTADAVVRPATSLLEPTQTGLRRLDDLAGAAFPARLRDELAVGSAVVTAGGALAAELVIHAIIRSATEPVTAGTVQRAFTSALDRADAWELAHVAAPPLGTGAGHLGLEQAAAAMARALAARAGRAHPQEITIVVENDEQRAVFHRTLGAVAS